MIIGSNKPPRPPLSAALLAQAESIERGQAILEAVGMVYVEDQSMVVVTWRGRDAAEQPSTNAPVARKNTGELPC